jgi:hypothetical protein
MTFVLNSVSPALGRNALEMLRHTGFGLQGCLLFFTECGGAIGHPGLGVRRTGPDTDKARNIKLRVFDIGVFLSDSAWVAFLVLDTDCSVHIAL